MKIETKHLDQKQINMAISYELHINNMEAASVDNNLEDVVKIIYWLYTGKETIDEFDLYGEARGAVGLSDPSSDSFTAFADLTEEQVKGWVESQLDLDAIKSDIADQIKLQKNPPTVVKSNPWGGEDEV
jgi:hypothetical protein